MTAAMFGFEKLRVWQHSVEFAGNVYGITKRFPKEELFGLTMQLRRASVSVAANIAEGASRVSGKDRARFFRSPMDRLMRSSLCCILPPARIL